MDDENEGDMEEDFVVDNDFGAENEDFYTVEEISSDFSRVLSRAVPQQDSYNNTVGLSWHDSDLNLVIDGKTFCTACPIHGGGFCFLQGGVRATHGFTAGSVCFEVKLGSLCNIRYIDGHLNSHLIRVGWSTYSSSLALGSDCKSFGYDSNGKASNNGESKIYGKTWTVDDVIGAYLDFSETMVSISFMVNGVDQGIAYKITRLELNNEALFPHVLSKNIAFECNFRSESSWFPPKKGYSLVGDTPLNKRIPGPVAPKRPADCEVIMMIGLPRSGKSSWTRQFCAKNPGKYYVLDVLRLVDKIEIMDSYRYSVFREKTHLLRKLLKIALTRCRNYILDQVNPSPVEWHWKLNLFKSYGRRRAVVCSVSDDELERRLKTRPLEHGAEFMDALKGKFILPKPSFLLNMIDYVGLPQMEAENLFKRYFQEAKRKGHVPKKKLNKPNDINQMNSEEQPPDWKLFLLGKGPNPHSTKARKAWKYQMRKGQRGGAIAFVSGGVYNESSMNNSQVELSTRNLDFQDDDDDLLRRGQSLPTRNMVERPPQQQSLHLMSSVSPPRNIGCGRGIAPDGRGGKDFYEGSAQQDSRPLLSGGQVDWRSHKRSSDSNYPPLRGDVAAQGRLANDVLEPRSNHGSGFSGQIPDGKMFGTAGLQEGRLQRGLPTQNCPAGFSLNRRGSEFEEFHPQRSSSGLLSSQTLRQRVGFPLTRGEVSSGEGQMVRDYVQRQRTAVDFPPLRKTEGGGLSTWEDRPGRFREVQGSTHGPLRQRDDYSPPREQMRSRGQREEGREIPLNKKQRISHEDMTPCSSRGDGFLYSENRMEYEMTRNNVRTSSNVLPILGERMILGSGDRPNDDVSSNVPEMLFTEDRFLDDESQHLTRNEGRDYTRPDHLVCDSQGVGIMVRQESISGSGLHPQRTRSISPYQEERLGGGCLPLEMGFCRNKELLKSGNTDWNRAPGAMREHPFQDRREDNANQPSSTRRSNFTLPSGHWEDPNSGLVDHSPDRGSRSPECRERFVSEDDPRWSPGSRSPVGYHNRRLYPGGSPDCGPVLSLPGSRQAPVFDPGDSFGRIIRKSPEGEGGHSPSEGVRRSQGHGGWGREDSPDQFGRGAPDQFRSSSPYQFTRTSPDQVWREPVAEIRDGSPYLLNRSSPNQSRRGFLDEVGAESLKHVQGERPGKFREEFPQFRRESPDQFREEHLDELRIELTDHFGRESPGGFREEHPDRFRKVSRVRQSPNQLRRERTDYFERESEVQVRRESSGQLIREIPGRFGRETPDQLWRESPDRFRRESLDRFREESQDQLGEESLDPFREEHPDHLRRECADQFGRGSVHQFRSGSPDQFKRGHLRSSPIRVSQGSFGHQRGSAGPQRRGYPGSHRRGAPGPHRRESPSPRRRESPGPRRRESPGPRRRESPGPRRREFPGHRRRGSQGPHRKCSPGPRRRGSPIEHYRGSANRDSRGPHILGAEGSPFHRSRSPVSGQSSSLGRVRRYSSDRNLRTSPYRNSRGSPTPRNSSPSAVSRTRTTSYLPDKEMGRSRRAQGHSPLGRYGNKRPPRGGMNRFNHRE